MRDNQPIIRTIDLKNYKCHSHFYEELNTLTILAGENSAGKSSVIQSLLLYDAAMRSSDGTVFTLDVGGINLGKASGMITESSGSEHTEITLGMNESENRFQLSVADSNDISFKISDKSIDKEDHFKMFYVNAERLGPRAYNNISSSDPFYVGTHGENTLYVINQLDILMKKPEYSENEGKKKWESFSEGSRFSAIVEECLQTIIPGTKLNVTTDPEQGTSSVRFTNGSGISVIPTATGFGITYVLPVIVQALASLLFTDSLLIIENPEAHLHPYSQSQLGRFLAKISSFGAQTIIETHSEHIINGCRLELAKLNQSDIANIIFFSRNIETSESSHTLIKIDESGELSVWPKGFFDQSEKDLFEVVKNKCRR